MFLSQKLGVLFAFLTQASAAKIIIKVNYTPTSSKIQCCCRRLQFPEYHAFCDTLLWCHCLPLILQAESLQSHGVERRGEEGPPWLYFWTVHFCFLPFLVWEGYIICFSGCQQGLIFFTLILQPEPCFILTYRLDTIINSFPRCIACFAFYATYVTEGTTLAYLSVYIYIY